MENALWKLLFYSVPCPVIISNREFQTLQCVTKEECENLCSKLYSACSGRGGKFQTHKMTCTGRKKKPSQIFKSGFEKHSRCMLHFTDRQIHNQCTMSQYVTGKQFGTGKLRNALLQAHQDQDRSTALFCKTLWHFLVFSHQLEGADTKNEY